MTPHMRRHRAFTLLVSAALLSACGKDPLQDITAPPLESGIRFFNFGVGTPNVNFYANDVKMTAVLTSAGTEATTGTVYGGVGANGLYTGIKAGQYNLKAKLSAATDTVSKVGVTIETGKFYSFYTSGFYDATAKTVEGFMVEDPIPAQIDLTIAYVRFVNAIPNSSPMTLYALPATGNEVQLGGTIAYKSAGAFATLPPGTYTLNTRTAGSATNVITRTGVAFLAGRVYTIGARGDITVTSTTAATRPILDNTPNR